MAIFELFSKRQKKLRGDVPDVYTYDDIPQPLRVQIVHIWKDSLGNEEEYFNSRRSIKTTYEAIVETLCREYGVFKLVDTSLNNRQYMSELINFLLHQTECDKTLDVIELSFKAIDNVTRNFNYHRHNEYDEVADNAISELNARFQEHGIGYQFQEGELIRVDSQLLHAEIIKPALHLLSSNSYSGAQQEFLNAYEHYRHGKQKEALNDALKAFESI